MQAAAGAWNAFEAADGSASAAPAAGAAPAAASGGDALWADFSSERAGGSAPAAPAKDPVQELFSLGGSRAAGGAAATASASESAEADPFGFDAFTDSSSTGIASAQPVRLSLYKQHLACRPNPDIALRILEPPHALRSSNLLFGRHCELLTPALIAA